jgi:hypothetical protein
MSLQFIGEAAIYFPDRDAVKVNAIAGDSVVECYALRSALEVLGCSAADTSLDIIRKFEARRIDCELAALLKYRRATIKPVALEITAADIVAAVERPHAA